MGPVQDIHEILLQLSSRTVVVVFRGALLTAQQAKLINDPASLQNSDWHWHENIRTFHSIPISNFPNFNPLGRPKCLNSVLSRSFKFDLMPVFDYWGPAIS